MFSLKSRIEIDAEENVFPTAGKKSFTGLGTRLYCLNLSSEWRMSITNSTISRGVLGELTAVATLRGTTFIENLNLATRVIRLNLNFQGFQNQRSTYLKSRLFTKKLGGQLPLQNLNKVIGNGMDVISKQLA